MTKNNKSEYIDVEFIGIDYWGRPIVRYESNRTGRTYYFCDINLSANNKEELIKSNNDGLCDWHTMSPYNDPEGEPNERLKTKLRII